VSADDGLRERGKARRRNRILDAAIELLRAGTGEALTVERIAERAEVSQATVFNLVGTRNHIWEALAARALDQTLDPRHLSGDDASRPPLQRAREVVEHVTNGISADAAVYRTLLANWSQSGRALEHDPAESVLECLREAVDAGDISPAVDVRRLTAVFGAGLNGLAHQWAAGVIDDEGLRQRAQDLVDVTFAAAAGAAPPPAWLGAEADRGSGTA